jgi:hypothetical protein
MCFGKEMKKILIRIINYGISYQLAAGDAGMLLHIIMTTNQADKQIWIIFNSIK